MMDLVGDRYGRLVVLEFSHKKQYKNFYSYIWKCQCDCGNISLVAAGDLRKKKHGVKSCGCRQGAYKENKLSAKDKLINNVFSAYRAGAKTRNLLFEISRNDVMSIIELDCFYCGCSPSNVYKYKGYDGELVYNGIDRMDSNKGYTKDNIVPCCWKCNYAKTNLPFSEFKDWIFRVFNFMNKNGVFSDTV